MIPQIYYHEVCCQNLNKYQNRIIYVWCWIIKISGCLQYLQASVYQIQQISIIKPIDKNMIDLEKQMKLVRFDNTDEIEYGDQLFIMIAASTSSLKYNSEECDQKINRGNQTKDKRNIKFQIRAQKLPGVFYDLSNFKSVMSAKDPRKVNILETSEFQSLFIHKQYILNYLKLRMASSYHTCYLFYSGHGNRKGDWVVETPDNNKGQIITLDEILEVWQNIHHSSHKLIIVMDSCFSGAWCSQLKKKKVKNVSIFASSDQTLTSYDGQRGGYLFNCLFRAKNFESTFQTLKSRKPKFITFKGQIFDLEYIHCAEANKNPGFLLNLASLVQLEDQNGKYQGQTCSISKKHGYGWYKNYKDKSFYAGQWDDGKKKGKGSMIYKQNGIQKYLVGQWENDMFLKEGNINIIPPKQIKRQNTEQKPQNKHSPNEKSQGGIQQILNQSIPETIVYGDGTYTGEVSQDKQRNGTGIRVYNSGLIYQGQWKNDRRHGKGIQILPPINGVQQGTYQGTWKNGKKDGLFVRVRVSGTRIIRLFQNDVEVPLEASAWFLIGFMLSICLNSNLLRFLNMNFFIRSQFQWALFIFIQFNEIFKVTNQCCTIHRVLIHQGQDR